MAADISLTQAIGALRNGDRAAARTILAQWTAAYENNTDGWLWRAAASDDAADKVAFLRRAYAINPHDQRVQAALRAQGITEMPMAQAVAMQSFVDIAPAIQTSASAKPALPVHPLARPHFAATGVRARRSIPWLVVALVCVILVLIPLTYSLM